MKDRQFEEISNHKVKKEKAVKIGTDLHRHGDLTSTFPLSQAQRAAAQARTQPMSPGELAAAQSAVNNPFALKPCETHQIKDTTRKPLVPYAGVFSNPNKKFKKTPKHHKLLIDKASTDREFVRKISELEDKDTEVYISHFRDDIQGTVVGYYEKEILHLGVSVCSEKDTFSKKIGVTTALIRVIECPVMSVRYPAVTVEGYNKGKFFKEWAVTAFDLFGDMQDCLPSIK